jgi:hypothetical protein
MLGDVCSTEHIGEAKPNSCHQIASTSGKSPMSRRGKMLEKNPLHIANNEFVIRLMQDSGVELLQAL